MSWAIDRAKPAEMGGAVAAFVSGAHERSSSVQRRIDRLRRLEVLCPHDQQLGGPSRQVCLGCRFPAAPACAPPIPTGAVTVGEALRGRGVPGRFGIAFVSVREDYGWRHRGSGIKLRKAGTTQPLPMLQRLTAGAHDAAAGECRAPRGRRSAYITSDDLESPRDRGLDRARPDRDRGAEAPARSQRNQAALPASARCARSASSALSAL